MTAYRVAVAGGRLNGDPARCPGVTCSMCPRSGCVCPPCACHACRLRHRTAMKGRTPLRARAVVPARERLFDVEPDPFRR